MKKQFSYRNIGQWVANLLLLLVLLGCFEVALRDEQVFESGANPVQSAWFDAGSGVVQGAVVEPAFFKGNKGEALGVQFAKHAFSFELDSDDGYRIVYMFYAFVVYLAYWTVRHKPLQP